MTEARQHNVADILGKLRSGPMLGSHQRRMEALMRHFHGLGYALADIADSRRLARSISTLRRYARRLDLIFPDYTPRHLRPKKEKP